MARSIKTGALTGRAASTQKSDDLDAMLDLIPLSEIEQVEIQLNVARKMHHNMKINKGLPGFKFTRKFYYQARRLEKRLAKMKIEKRPAPLPRTEGLSAGEQSAALSAWMDKNWGAIPEVSL